MAKHIFVLNGPNLNLLGTREPHIYGTQTLDDIKKSLERLAALSRFTIDFRQSNHEGILIDWIQEARSGASGLILNAASFSHTSIGLYDALKTLAIPVIEVHLSNPYAREAFRQHSYVSLAATGVICGLGGLGYSLALDALIARLDVSPSPSSPSKPKAKR